MKNTGNTRRAGIVILSLIALNVGTWAFVFFHNAERPFPRPGLGKNDPVYIFFKEEIGFDQTQLATFEQMRLENRAEMKVHNTQMRTLKDSFFGNLAAEAKNQAEIDSLATSIGQLQTSIDLTVFHHFSHLREICTDKQKEKFDLLIEDLLRRNRPPQGPPPGERR